MQKTFLHKINFLVNIYVFLAFQLIKYINFIFILYQLKVIIVYRIILLLKEIFQQHAFVLGLSILTKKNYKKVNEYPTESKPYYQCTLVDPTVHLPHICVSHFCTPSQSGPLLQVLAYPWQLIVLVRIQRVVCHISYTYRHTGAVITVQGKIYGT